MNTTAVTLHRNPRGHRLDTALVSSPQTLPGKSLSGTTPSIMTYVSTVFRSHFGYSAPAQKSSCCRCTTTAKAIVFTGSREDASHAGNARLGSAGNLRRE